MFTKLNPLPRPRLWVDSGRRVEEEVMVNIMGEVSIMAGAMVSIKAEEVATTVRPGAGGTTTIRATTRRTGPPSSTTAP